MPPLTGVWTRYMSPTLRSSAACVTSFLPSATRRPRGAALVTHPRCSSRSRSPSFVGGQLTVLAVARSRTHKFQSQMNTPRPVPATR